MTENGTGGTTPSSVNLDDLAGWIEADRTLTAKIGQLTEARDDVRQRIKDAMGDAVEARVDGVPMVRWAHSAPGTYIDKKALEADHPDLAAQYTRERKPARRYVLIDPAKQ